MKGHMTDTQTILYSVDFDEDNGSLDREAALMTASSEEDAKQKLADFYDQCCTPSRLVVRYGWATLSREWRKLSYEPSPDDLADICNEFGGKISPSDLTVSAPGTHPGGSRWWVSCRLSILVVRESVEIPDADVPDTPLDCENWDEAGRFIEAGGAWVNSSAYGRWGLYTDEEVANWPPCDGIPSSVMAELVRRSGRWFSADQLRSAKAQQVSGPQ